MTITTLGRGAARRAIASAALLALFATPAPLSAQRDASPPPLGLFETADDAGWVLRATLADGTVVTGRVRAVDDGSVRLEGGRFDPADVVSIERAERHGGGGRTGLAVGAAGLVVGAILVAMNGLPVDDGDGGGGAAGAILLLGIIAAVGAVIGGLIGAAADPAETEWHPIWPEAAPE